MQLRTPRELGLPEQYDTWRPGQEEAILAGAHSNTRITVLSASTGFGKQNVGVGIALESGDPTCIVTESRGLQDDYVKNFKSIGITDLRGRNNYTCGWREDYT